MPADGGVDVARNARAIEWLRTELVRTVADVHKALTDGDDEALGAALAETVLVSALLARRTGLGLERLENLLLARIRANVVSAHELERWYGDMSALLARLEARPEERPAPGDAGTGRERRG
ncbi:MAG: MazG-like family protein [Clostridia bacterium]|nr:MazG-like family protein [Clostridia bacterium]MCL6521854.1 MazG-like family protein [Bacillota bacterium]